MSVCAGLGVMLGYICGCLNTHGSQRTTLGIIIKDIVHLLWDRVSHWPGAHHAGYTGWSGSSRESPVPTSSVPAFRSADITLTFLCESWISKASSFLLSPLCSLLLLPSSAHTFYGSHPPSPRSLSGSWIASLFLKLERNLWLPLSFLSLKLQRNIGWLFGRESLRVGLSGASWGRDLDYVAGSKRVSRDTVLF